MIYPVVEVVKCQLCGKRSAWTCPAVDATRPKWCKNHENRAKRAVFLCPTPGKDKHPTKDRALLSAAYANRKRATPLRVYECKCTYWHLTSKVEAATRR